MRLGAAYSPVLNAPRFNAPIDPLASLPRHNLSVPFELQWQMKNRFGLVFQFRHINISANIRADFTERMNGSFLYNYYATIDFPGVYDEFNHGEDATQAFFSLSYAMNAGKWSLQPRLMLGGTTFYPLAADIVLKRRDSNELSLLTLQPDNTDESGAATSLTFGLGTLLERHLWRRWSLFGIAEWTAFKPNLTYTYSLENQITGAIQTQDLSSDELVQMLHLGAGLTFRISRK